MSDVMPEINKWNHSTSVEGHICRLCLSISDLLIPIFQGEGLEQALNEKIHKYLPIKISPLDSLPQHVCYHCAGTLVAWNSLYNLCLKSNEKLQLLLNSDEVDPEVIRPNHLQHTVSSKKRKAVDNAENVATESATSRAEKMKEINYFSREEMAVSECRADVTGKAEEGADGDSKFESRSATKNDKGDQESAVTPIKTEADDDAIRGNVRVDDSEIFKCETCNRTYKDKKCLSRHIKKCHNAAKGERGEKCDLCNNIYKTKSNLQRHYTKEHLTNQVSCPVCHSSFNSKKLDFHLKSAHGVKTEKENEQKFKCKSCEKWFKNKYVRNSHVKEVHMSEPVKCKLCDFEGLRTVLRRHKKDVHAEKRFLCSLCPGAFKTLHTLKLHMTSHSDIRSYTCDICGMSFKRLNNVRDHMKCHEQKSNQCQICGNFFARKRYLAIHEKTIHNFYADGIVPEVKGFECEICGAKLKWKKNLLAHMRIHTGEKPYVCKICNKNFTCHGSLRIHMAKHNVYVLNDSDSQNLLSVEVKAFTNFSSENVGLT